MKLKLFSLTAMLFVTASSALSQTAGDAIPANSVESQLASQPQLPVEPVPVTETPPPGAPVQVLFTMRDEETAMGDLRPGHAAFGALGGLAAANAGKSLAENNAITNPGNRIAKAFAEHFASENGLSVAPTGLAIGKGKITDVKAILNNQHPGANFIIDATPAFMSLTYLPLDWGHDTLIFSDAVSVLDAGSGKVLLKSTCSTPLKKDPNNLYTRAELLADNGRLLKELIDRKTDECLTLLIRNTASKIKLSTASTGH